MSLRWRRGAIERAVAGDLPAGEEAGLRAHLGGCAACRDHYDTLTAAARALGGSAGPTATERARESARLRLALDALAGGASAADTPSRPARAPRWRWSLALLPAAAALALWLAPRPAGEPSVTWRGAVEEEPLPRAHLLVYAAGKLPGGAAGAVRLLADFPGAGEASVPLASYLQFKLAGVPAAKQPAVYGWDGRTLRSYPVGGASVDLAAAHSPGVVRLWAIVSDAPIDPARVEAALRKGDPGDLPGAVLRGELRIVP